MNIFCTLVHPKETSFSLIEINENGCYNELFGNTPIIIIIGVLLCLFLIKGIAFAVMDKVKCRALISVVLDIWMIGQWPIVKVQFF